MTTDIVSRLSARKQQTGVAARIAGTVVLALLLCNGDTFSSDSAAPRPVAPHAGQTVDAILRYLDALSLRSSGRCLTGQAVGANGDSHNARALFQEHVVGLERETGHRPAVLEYALSHLNGKRMTESEQKVMQAEIVARWREGHLIYLRFRPAHPQGLDLKKDMDKPGFYITDINTVVPAEGVHARAYQETLAYAADFIAPLEDAGVPLLFELFNEFNGNWNWMGKAEPEEFQKLWRHTFDYFARGRKFSNLLFVLEYSSNTLQREKFSAKDYYPGDDCVDIVGFDFYHDDPQDKYVDVYQQVFEFGKPVAMTEYGPNLREYRNAHKISMGKAIDVWDNMVQLEFTKKFYPECCFFIRWGNDWSIISQKNAKEFMADPWWVEWDQFKRASQTDGWR